MASRSSADKLDKLLIATLPQLHQHGYDHPLQSMRLASMGKGVHRVDIDLIKSPAVVSSTQLPEFFKAGKLGLPDYASDGLSSLRSVVSKYVNSSTEVQVDKGSTALLADDRRLSAAVSTGVAKGSIEQCEDKPPVPSPALAPVDKKEALAHPDSNQPEAAVGETKEEEPPVSPSVTALGGEGEVQVPVPPGACARAAEEAPPDEAHHTDGLGEFLPSTRQRTQHVPFGSEVVDWSALDTDFMRHWMADDALSVLANNTYEDLSGHSRGSDAGATSPGQSERFASGSAQ